MSKVFSITKGLENRGAMRTDGEGSVYNERLNKKKRFK